MKTRTRWRLRFFVSFLWANGGERGKEHTSRLSSHTPLNSPSRQLLPTANTGQPMARTYFLTATASLSWASSWELGPLDAEESSSCSLTTSSLSGTEPLRTTIAFLFMAKLGASLQYISETHGCVYTPHCTTNRCRHTSAHRKLTIRSPYANPSLLIFTIIASSWKILSVYGCRPSCERGQKRRSNMEVIINIKVTWGAVTVDSPMQ